MRGKIIELNLYDATKANMALSRAMTENSTISTRLVCLEK